MKTICGALVLASALTGCASITGETGQLVRVETLDQNGENIKGAKCTLQNEYGNFTGESGSQIMVRRSSKDLFIECRKEGYADATANAVSRANGGMFGNILFGGGIGAIIDHNKGTAYTYPEWMKLVFGKVLAFDRSDDKDGQPSLAKQPTGTGTSTASTATATSTPAAAVPATPAVADATATK